MKRHDVVPGGGAMYWKAITRGGKHTSHKTKRAARNAAYERASKGDKVYIHNADGSIREVRSVGGVEA